MYSGYQLRINITLKTKRTIGIIETAKKHLSEFYEWIEYTDEEKEELVRNLLYPLNYEEAIFKELIEYVNSHFSE